MDYAYQFVIKNKGIDTEDDYPYQSRDTTCNKNKANNLFFVFACIILFSAVHASCFCILLVYQSYSRTVSNNVFLNNNIP